MRWKRRKPSKTRNTENTPTLHVHGNARCPLSPLNLRRQLLRPRRQTTKRKENETRQKQEFELPNHRIQKSDENFFFRAAKLYIIRRTTEKPMTKKLLTEMYQNYFHRSYNELDSCTSMQETSMQLWNLQSNEKTCAKRKLKGLHPCAPTLKTLLLLLLLLSCVEKIGSHS